MIRFTFILCLAAGWTHAVFGDATSTTSTNPGAGSQIDCLQESITLCGKSINALDLISAIDVEAAGNPDIDSFVKLSRHLGLHVARFEHLSSAELRCCHCPVLLHVSSTAYSTRPDRFVLFLGTQQGLARIYIDSMTERSISFPALAKAWQGEAIGLSAHPISVAGMRAILNNDSIFFAVVALASVLAFRSWYRPDQQPMSAELTLKQAGSSVVIAAIMIGVATFLGFLNDQVLGDGILLRQMTDAPPSDEAPFELKKGPAHDAAIIELGVDDAVRRWRNGDLFVDARPAGEFDTGHVRGAVSAPSVDPQGILLELSTVSKETPLVVYCNSSACARARYVAAILQDNGYRRVAIYPDGWAAWPR